MKRFIILALLTTLAVSAIPAQDLNLQIAVATQALNRDILERLDLDEDRIDEILALQEQFRLRKERTAVEMNLIKAQLAQKLYYADSNSNEINRMLEEASRLRLEEEKEQVRVYQQIRLQLGEENWSKLVQRIRSQERRRLQLPEEAEAQTQERTQTRPPHPGIQAARELPAAID